MLIVHQWIRLNELYELMESFFFQTSNLFSKYGRNKKIFNRIDRRKYWSNRNVLHIDQWICLK